jgi:hypothetical protein
MENNKCEICINVFNNGTNKRVNCHCDYNCCIKCAKKYFNEVNEIKCMNCNNEWDRKFLVKNFGKTFINKEYKIYRENMLFKLEEKMFPDTQPYIEKQKKLKNINNSICEKTKELNELYAMIETIRYEETIKLNEKIAKLKSETSKIIEYKTFKENIQLHNIRLTVVNLKEEYNTLYLLNNTNFILPTNIKCRNNNCNGNLDDNFYCNLCEMESCSICYEIKCNEKCNEHICDEKTLQTIEFVKKNLKVKPCPNCNIDISLTEGCQDMFCSKCKTTFNFGTLKITKGNTNEDYKRYISELKKINLNTSVICPSELDDNYNVIIMGQEHNLKLKYGDDLNDNFYEHRYKITSYFFSILQIKRELNRYINLPTQFNRTLQLRISYMKQCISKEYFKSEIQKIDKDHAKREELSEILTMYTEIGSDLLNYFLIEFTQKNKQVDEYIHDINLILTKIDNLIEITNKAFIDMSYVYNCKVYNINPSTFSFI